MFKKGACGIAIWSLGARGVLFFVLEGTIKKIRAEQTLSRKFILILFDI